MIAGLLAEVLPEGLLDRVRLYQDADLWVDVVRDPPAGGAHG